MIWMKEETSNSNSSPNQVNIQKTASIVSDASNCVNFSWFGLIKLWSDGEEENKTIFDFCQPYQRLRYSYQSKNLRTTFDPY